MADVCFDCGARMSRKAWPLVAEYGFRPGNPEILKLVNGICPVSEGSKALDPEDLEG